MSIVYHRIGAGARAPLHTNGAEAEVFVRINRNGGQSCFTNDGWLGYVQDTHMHIRNPYTHQSRAVKREGE